MLAPLMHIATRRVPNPPFRGVLYKTALSTTANETTTTWTGIDIGVPHPDRIVILAIYQGVNGNIIEPTDVNGIPNTHIKQLNEFGITVHPVPLDTTAIIRVSATSSIRKGVSVYIAYGPAQPIESGAISAGTTNPANLNNWKTIAGGFAIYSGGQHSTLGTFTTTWNGTETLVEDKDVQIESAASVTTGNVNNMLASDNTFDLSMSASASGTKRCVGVSFYPPRPGLLLY
jgi:hypothetical protein